MTDSDHVAVADLRSRGDSPSRYHGYRTRGPRGRNGVRSYLRFGVLGGVNGGHGLLPWDPRHQWGWSGEGVGENRERGGGDFRGILRGNRGNGGIAD